jgi:hypothetical protein
MATSSNMILLCSARRVYPVLSLTICSLRGFERFRSNEQDHCADVEIS